MSEVDQDLWQKCIITEAVLKRAEQHREQALDLSWFVEYIVATVEDCVEQHDLKPEWMVDPALSHIWSTHVAMPLARAFEQLVAGELRVDSPYIVSVPSTRTQPGYGTFGFHINDSLKTFDLFRFGVKVEGPTVQLLLTHEDRLDLVPIDPGRVGEPVYQYGVGLQLLPNIHYEFLFDNPLPMAYCWEFALDSQDDADAAQLIAFTITKGAECADAIRLIKRDCRFMGLTYLSPFKFWLREWGVDAGSGCAPDPLAFEHLANGDFALAAEMLRDVGLTATLDFVAAKFAAVFGFEERGVRLYLS